MQTGFSRFCLQRTNKWCQDFQGFKKNSQGQEEGSNKPNDWLMHFIGPRWTQRITYAHHGGKLVMVIVLKQKHRRRGLTKRENWKDKWCSKLTVAARMSCGQQARRKDLQTFGSLYFVPADSPEKRYIVRKYNFKNQFLSTLFIVWINTRETFKFVRDFTE